MQYRVKCRTVCFVDVMADDADDAMRFARKSFDVNSEVEVIMAHVIPGQDNETEYAPETTPRLQGEESLTAAEEVMANR